MKKVRLCKTYSKQQFLAELMSINWFLVLTSDNVNFSTSEFGRLFRGVIDKVAPYKEVRVRNKTNPWMNSPIMALIRKEKTFCSL